MYALAQLFAIAVAIMDLRAISVQPAFVNPGALRTRTLWLPIVVFWLAVFSHLVTALLLPAMVAVALVIFGRSLLREQRDLTLALAVCALAPVRRCCPCF